MRLYVLVREDLSPSQQAVQAGHAIAQWCLEEAGRYHWDGREVRSLPWRWENRTLVLLAVRDEAELREWHGQFEDAVAFYEPDIDNQMTAFAVFGKQRQLRDLKLL